MQACNQTGMVSYRATENFSPISFNVKALDGNEVNLTRSKILTQRKISEENAAKNLNIRVEDFRLACKMFDIRTWDFATVRPEDYRLCDDNPGDKQALEALFAYVSNKDEGPSPKKQRCCGEAGNGSAARPSPVSAASTVSCSPAGGDQVRSSFVNLTSDDVSPKEDPDLTQLLSCSTSPIDDRPIHQTLFAEMNGNNS